MRPLSTFSDCRNTAFCCRSLGHEREVNIQSDRSRVCWQCPGRLQNIPGSADLVTSAQIPALSLCIVQSSSDRSEHSASRLRHRHDNGARTSHRCSIQWRYYLRHQKKTKQIISIGLSYTCLCFCVTDHIYSYTVIYTVTSESWDVVSTTYLITKMITLHYSLTWPFRL